MTTHRLAPRSADRTACGLEATDPLGRPLPEVETTDQAASCPTCEAYRRVDAWIRHEQRRLVRRGMSGEEALRSVLGALSDQETADWLCEPVDTMLRLRELRRRLVRWPPGGVPSDHEEINRNDHGRCDGDGHGLRVDDLGGQGELGAPGDDGAREAG